MYIYSSPYFQSKTSKYNATSDIQILSYVDCMVMSWLTYRKVYFCQKQLYLHSYEDEQISDLTYGDIRTLRIVLAEDSYTLVQKINHLLDSLNVFG